MNSQSNHSTGGRIEIRRASGFALLVLLILAPLVAFFLPRWIGYDIPNLSQPWRPAAQVPPNATEFLGAPANEPFMLVGAFIGTADGQVYEQMPRPRLVDEVPDVSQQEMLAMRQKWRPLIPYVLIEPPGEVVDYYQSTVHFGSLLDRGPLHYVILADGTIWSWYPSSYSVLGFQYLGLIYAALTLVAVFVLLRLHRLWPDTWFWHPAIYRKWELVIRVVGSMVAALVPGALIFGLFLLPFNDNLKIFLIIMALLTTLIAVPCLLLIRKQSVAVVLPVVVAWGILIHDEVSRLFTYRNWGFFDWTLFISLPVAGLLTALAIKLLIAYFRQTAKVSPSGEANSMTTLALK